MTERFGRHSLADGTPHPHLGPFATLAAVALILSSGTFAHSQSGTSSAVEVPAAVDQHVTELELSKPIALTLKAGDTHYYALRMQKDQCAVIDVEQRGVDVVVQLLGPNNHALVEADDQVSRRGTEKLEIVSDQAGAYSIAVKSKSTVLDGDYQISTVELRSVTEMDRSLYEVGQLRTEVRHLISADKPLEALPLAQRALALAERALGPENENVGRAAWDVAEITYANGKPSEAKQGFERALRILTEKLGPEHPETIQLRGRLGSLNTILGDFSKADQLLSQALEQEERTLGPDDPMVAGTLKSLALLHANRGDLGKAEKEDLRALAILERAGETDLSSYGELLNNLGVDYFRQGDLEKAQIYYERGLAFEEKKFGPESPDVSKALNNLGIVARRKRDYPAAEKYLLRALAMKETYVGPDHPEYAAVLMNLGNVYGSEGDYKKALETHLRALHIFERDTDSGDTILSLANVAKLYAVFGDFENANKMQSRLESALEEDISLNLAIGSERQKLTYLNSIAQRTERAVSLNLQLEPDSAQAAATAATVLLQRKGRVLDATTDTLGALRKHSDPEDQALLDQLKEATTHFARVALKGPQKQPAEEYRKLLQGLQENREALENRINHHNEEFRAASRPVTLEAVQNALPADSALVEFVTYRPFNPKAQTDAEQYGERHYGAYVLHHGAAPKGVDLGDAKAIDIAVAKLRAALRDPSRSDVQELSRAVAEKVFQPLLPLVADDKRLLISPDGQLDLVPFEALVDGQGHYLVERFPISYLTTGRDLLRMQVPRSSSSVPVIVADPFFDEPAGIQVADLGKPPVKPPNAHAVRRSVTIGSDFSTLYFAPLATTRTEAQNIHALFPDAQVLTGKQASEASLEQLNAPKILHIATHGFFLQDAGQQTNTGVSRTQQTASDDIDNPLLHSGLALSGANLAKNGTGAGILTALEASNLNLWGTKLVTLSACDTGVGEVKNGQGVYGLRRSFFLAGAESLVMSLWPVSDYVTREMMSGYYRGLKQGLGRGDALRQVQLAMLKRKDRQHPFYWASFIQAGEWANLDGQR